MANICYTQYRVEGPTENIKRLANRINEDNNKSFYRGSCREFLYGTKMKEITSLDIQPMTGGMSVLSFEAASKWSPAIHQWREYIRKIVKGSEIYYYGEELWCGVCETNDVWKKYFDFDYVTMIAVSDLAGKKYCKTFIEYGEYREREDQYKKYYKYWTARELRGALLQFVPYRRRSNLELIEKMDTLILREDWYNSKGILFTIYPVKRLEKKLAHPCTNCKRKSDQMLTIR